jgi:hypothetical protein
VTITVYQLDANGHFAGTTVADESPRQPGVYLMPAGCVTLAPPEHKAGTNRKYADGKWSYDPIIGYGDPAPMPAEPTLADIKAAKNAQINAWRASADATVFEYAGKLFGCDAASRAAINDVAQHIALLGTFPDGFAGVWKASDNALVPMTEPDEFAALYAALAAAGAANFNRAQVLKAELAAAETPDAVAAIVWRP